MSPAKTLCVNLMGVVLLGVGGAVRVGGRIHMDIYPAFHLLIPGRSDREGSQALDSTQAGRRSVVDTVVGRTVTDR
jgi:hypothetical protein